MKIPTVPKFLIFSICIITGPVVGISRDILQLSKVEGPIYGPLHDAIYDALKPFSSEFEFELTSYPVSRGLDLAESGKIDGASLRLDPAFLGSGIYNLVAIATPLIMTRTLLVIRDDAPDILSWEETKNLKVSAWRGTLLSRRLLPEEARYEVTNEAQGLQMVQSRRLDAALIMEAAYYGTAMNNPEVTRGLRFATVIFEAPMYMLLHKKNARKLQALDVMMKKAWASKKPQKAWDDMIAAFKLKAIAAYEKQVKTQHPASNSSVHLESL